MMESIHGRIDLLTQEQIDWCDEYCNFIWFVKDDGKVYSNDESIYFKNKETIRSFPVKFGDCEKFGCSRCRSLVSLEGAPKNINEHFYCTHCDLLVSLEGAPESVGGDFNCFYCKSLKSLKGAPESVGGDFSCAYCDSLKSLKEAPESVGGNFGCSHCESLKSLDGSPKNVGGNFNCVYCGSLELLKGISKCIGKDFVCHECESLKSIDELKNTKIDGKIYHDDCPKLEKYEFILDNMNMFRRWQKSEYTADEFLKEWSGYFDAQKYGI